MNSRSFGARAAARVALCASALGLGALLGRFTDIAREPSALGPTKAHAAAAPSAPRHSSTKRAKPQAVQEPVLSAKAAEQAREIEPEAEHPDEPPAPPSVDALGEALRDGLIMTGATPHRLILFTFDDGPSRFTTPELLDRLDATGVRAIFFLTGSNLRGDNVAERMHQEIARDTVRRGHVVASHGYMHKQLPLLNTIDAMAELTQTEKIFEDVLGARPWLFRPPGGAHSARIDRLLASRGYTTVLWNIGAGDFQVRTAEDVHKTFRSVFERREAQGERGGIVLLHDTYAWSVEAYQLIVNDLLARNCELLDKGEELFDFVDDPSVFFQRRDRETASAVAAPAVLDPQLLELRQARLREDTDQRCRALAQR
jgi:peptidoglycan/xylan/chitin deacetylase (PgdA/CDA1 family)